MPHFNGYSTAVPNNFTDKYVQRRVVADLEFDELCPDNNFLIRLQSLSETVTRRVLSGGL